MRICTTDLNESTWFHHYLAKKEAKRLEKEAKLAAKAAKAVATTTPAGEKKVKEKAAKDEVAPFVNTTPKGQKKGEFVLHWTDAWSYCIRRTLALGIEWELFSTERHAHSLPLQICRGPWLQDTIRLLSKPPGTIGGSSKVSSSRSWLPTADPSPRVSS